MIFKTFNNDLDGISNKLGFSKRSFAEWGKQVSASFQEADGFVNKFANVLKTAFTVQSDSDWKTNELGEIVSKENIDSYIAELDLDSAKDKLSEIFDWETNIKNGDATWQNYFDTLQDGTEKYIPDLIKDTDDLSKLTGEDLVEANQAARKSAIAHNAALKQQTIAAKAGQAALKGLAVVGNMFAAWAFVKIIEGVAGKIDDFVHRVENANEAMEEAVSDYDSTMSELESINSELDANAQKIDEIKSKGELSYVEKGQIEELEAATEQLKLQKDILEKKAALEKEDKAEKAVEAYDTQYGNVSISQETVERYVKDGREYGSYYTPSSDDDISAQIANYVIANEKAEEVRKKIKNSKDITKEEIQYLEDEIAEYERNADDFSGNLTDSLQDLVDKQLAMQDTYNYAIEKQLNGENLSSTEQKVMDRYKQISKDMMLIYEYLDPDKYREMQISSIFDTQGIEKSKDELIEMAKAGELDESVINGYKNLKSAMDDNGISAKDLCNDIYSLVDAEKESDKAANETAISTQSIAKAWEALKTTDDEGLKNTREDLLKLAEAGQLTEETFHETAGADTFLEGINKSLPETIKWINQLVSSSTQLDALSGQISKISDMLADKKNGTVADASDLAGFDAEVQGLDSWEEFEQVMGSFKSTMEQCQKAANKLATEWVNSNNFLSNLDDTNKDYYITQLKNMGVSNARAVVENALANKELEVALQTEYAAAATSHNSDEKNRNSQVTSDLSNATAEEIQKLAEEQQWSDKVTMSLLELALKKQLVNGTTIDFSADLTNLEAYMEALGYASDALRTLNAIRNGEDAEYNYPPEVLKAIQKSAQDNVDDALDAIENAKKKQVKINPSGSSDYTGGSGSGSNSKSGSGTDGSSKDSKTEIDFIDIKLKRLQKNLDITKDKYENLFTVKAKQNNLDKQIKQTTKLLNANEKAAEKYKKKADSIKLSDKLKKKVRNGDYDITEYDSETSDLIDEYKKWWDLYKEKQQNTITLETDRRKLKSDRHQVKIDEDEAKIQKYETLMDNTSSYKKRISYLKKIRELTKDSYKEQIKQAKIDGTAAEVDKIRAERKKELKENEIAQHEELADHADKQISKQEALAELDEGNYKKQNKHLEKQKKYTKDYYREQIKIAKKSGDILEVDRLRAEEQKKLNDLTKQEFDNIAATYDLKTGLSDNELQAYQDEVSLLEARGYTVGESLYEGMMETTAGKKDILNEEYADQLEALNNFTFGTKEWYEAQDAASKTASEIRNCDIEMANFQKSINQFKFDRFDNLLDKMNDIVDETDFLIGMLDSDNFFDDNGSITDDGITAMGLTAQKYNVYLAEAEKYKEQQDELRKMFENGEISPEEYESKMREYQQGQRDMIKSANEAKETVIDYVEQGLEAEEEALSNLIEKEKELLESEKDLYDFQQKLKNQNKTISDLEKQISALEADDSEGNRKKLQELKSQLAEAKQEMQDTLYEHSIEEKQKSWDKMLTDKEDADKEYLKDSEKVFSDSIDYINKNAETVSQNLENLAKETGYDISEYITDAWEESGDAVGTYESILEGSVPKVNMQIQAMTTAWQAQTQAINETAEAARQYAETQFGTQTGQGKEDDDSDSDNTKSALSGAGSAVGAALNISSGIIAGIGALNANADKQRDEGDNTKSAVRQFIESNATSAKKKKSEYGVLNQYIYSKTNGKVLSKADTLKLGELLGVKVSSELTGVDKNKILDALKKAGFHNGGLISAKSIGEDGLALVKNKEGILTPVQTKALMNMAPMMPNIISAADMLKNATFASRQPASNTININTTVEGVATDKIVKDFESVATKQAENVIAKINSASYAKGVRRR